MTKLCKKCNEEKEHTTTGKVCKDCKREYNKKYCEDNSEKETIRWKKWAQVNRDKKNIRSKQWAHANPTKVVESSKKWKKNNPAKANAHNAKRRAAKLQRTPTWLTKAALQRIEKKYEMATLMSGFLGVELHVDHIIPLQGDLVSGLHVPENLQMIFAEDNLSKNNKFTPGVY